MKKKVLMIATYGDFFASFETHNIKILNEMGMEVTLCANWIDPKYNYKEKKLEGLKFTKENIEFQRSPFNKKNIKCFFELMKLMKANKYNLVDCHNAVIGVYARISARINSVPFVMYTAHGFQFYKNGPRKDWLIYYPVEKILSKITDRILVMNEEDFEYTNNFFCEKIDLIPGVGVDISSFSNIQVNRKEMRATIGVEEDSFLIISIGELSKRKNHAVVIEAMSKLANKKVEYLIAGIGPHRKELENLTKKFNIENQVHFLGYRSDIKEILKIVDISIFPSFREGLMVAGIESLASGVPLISSNRKGIRDYTIEGYNGFLFEPNDVDKLRYLIEYAVNNQKELLELSKNAIESSKVYDIEKVNNTMKKIYKEVLLSYE